MARPYLKLGEILVKEGIVTQAQLEEVIKIQAKEGGRLGELLLKMGFATEEVSSSPWENSSACRMCPWAAAYSSPWPTRTWTF